MSVILETLRQKLDEAWTAASTCVEAGIEDADDIKDGIADLIADCGGLIENARQSDPETIADRADEERHVNGLRAWQYGRV